MTPFQPPEEKRAAYAADITYGTNNEFGFDYLRDNMAFSMEEKFQRELNFAVIDEVDSILIDEARTPLIISGQAEDSSKLYMEINKLIPQLELHVEEVEGQVTKAGHYTIDEKTRQVELNEAGHQFIEEMLTGVGLLAEGESLYSAHNLGLLTHVYSGLRAHKLFHRNVEYIVQDGQVVLVDEHTGRTMPGRRLSEGLHQAIEAKEGPEHSGREPDPGLDHVPELLPSVHQAVRHDRYRRHRSVRIPPDLWPAGHGHSAEQAVGA